ncbi:hypothetical protein MESS4_110089 [Mesorhizobium sp. STM 4661]|nr:hypothetical protein MESS4_110089 [Mesorhizobium sp. STM 4661]
MHIAQKHALGLEPGMRSGFAITTCIKQEPKARRMNPFKRDALWDVSAPYDYSLNSIHLTTGCDRAAGWLDSQSTPAPMRQRALSADVRPSPICAVAAPKGKTGRRE